MSDCIKISEALIATLRFTECETEGRDESHGYKHHCNVVDNAIKYCTGYLLYNNNTSPITGISAEDAGVIIAVAAALHDVVDYKYCKTEAGLQDLLKKIRSLLLEHFSEHVIEGIIKMILNLSWSKEKVRGFPDLGVYNSWADALKILMDADRKEAIGSEGIDRCYEYTRMMNPEASDERIIELVKQHIDEKLCRLLPDGFIHTAFAREDCQADHEYVVEWYNEH